MKTPETNESPNNKPPQADPVFSTAVIRALNGNRLPTFAAGSIPFDDNVLERLVIDTENRINQLKSRCESTLNQKQILAEESFLKANLVMSASGTSHEGRVIQALEIHTRHISTALEYLRLYLKDHPGASLADLSEVTDAISFNQRALLNALPIADNLERFGSRSTLR